jgi:hypothetical protein
MMHLNDFTATFVNGWFVGLDGTTTAAGKGNQSLP